MADTDSGNHEECTPIEKHELAEVGRMVESWVGGLPFEAVYELAKRFHFHLALKLFIEDKEGFEELKSAYGDHARGEVRPLMEVTEMLISQMDDIAGFNLISSEDTPEVESDQPSVTTQLPDREFFDNLGIA
ncbi:hypothetical protein FIM07_04690 [SAR202 cluster bacterium AD-802-F09_MRT_200m]|nr:hypothetical protein [SAR202 cluster bacterium AD-802-F09_MRT_200m]